MTSLHIGPSPCSLSGPLNPNRLAVRSQVLSIPTAGSVYFTSTHLFVHCTEETVRRQRLVPQVSVTIARHLNYYFSFFSNDPLIWNEGRLCSLEREYLSKLQMDYQHIYLTNTYQLLQFEYTFVIVERLLYVNKELIYTYLRNPHIICRPVAPRWILQISDKWNLYNKVK